MTAKGHDDDPVELDGVSYIFQDGLWIEEASNMVAPNAVCQRLESLVAIRSDLELPLGWHDELKPEELPPRCSGEEILRFYSQLLGRPEWQELRARIITERGEFCERCHTTTNLVVHHRAYVWGLMPWGYPDGVFEVLCRLCHENLHRSAEVVPRLLVANGYLQEWCLTCTRCAGRGLIPQYSHVQGGICFRCWGGGTAVERFDQSRAPRVPVETWAEIFREASPQRREK